LNTSDFFYELPEELIAQTPAEPRDSSRLLVYHRRTGGIEHRLFSDIPEYLQPGDALIINETRVLPVRIEGTREDTGGRMELLLLRRLDGDTWEALAGPARKAKVGSRFSFGDGKLRARVLAIGEEGVRTVELFYEGVFEEILDQVGVMPLPPYIHERLKDKNRYQTVYAVHNGSAAAPTAGLHFTPELLERVRAMGVTVVPVTLHVGLGTFRPVKVEEVETHVMHREYYEVSQEAADTLNRIRKAGGRWVCVGTTSVRTLETVTDEAGTVHAGKGETGIFIYPGYAFHAADALITNFHLPQSTLLMMISAFGGYPRMLEVYKTAVRERYRFFSFGDAMFIG